MSRQQLEVIRTGEQAALIYQGRLVCTLPSAAAMELGRALVAMARTIDTETRAEVVGDQAILLRAGVPLNLTGNPAIMAQAKTDAQWDTQYRRMPNRPGVGSAEKVERPAIRRGTINEPVTSEDPA